jgi:tetratricopeptide (TPR) repeat protein
MAAMLLAAGTLGFLIWALTTSSASRLAWLTSIAAILAVVLPGWGMSVAMLTWVMRSRRAVTAARPAHVTGPGNPAVFRLRSLPELDPFELEVHRSVEADSTRELPALPVYIPRDHDYELRKAVARAAGGQSQLAVLVGSSSTGKTRACWETLDILRDADRQWKLWHPISPGRPGAVMEGLSRIGRHTVVWLNDMQLYLLTPGSDEGEQVAAGLRELLRAPEYEPVLVLGTLWPEYWATLTAPPKPGGADPHAQARELLVGTSIKVPDAFTGDARQAIRDAASVDPRLALAVASAEDGRVAQFLSGVPLLTERYRTAPPAPRAVIDAAVDARRLGHGPAIPRALLAASAPGYLVDDEWDRLGDDWLEQALDYACLECRGTPGPLTRIRPRPGQAPHGQPCYRLADYLEQTIGAERRSRTAPVALWEAFPAQADRSDLTGLADQARRRGLYQHAFKLYAAAAQAGDEHALRGATRLLADTGRVEEAIGWLGPYADAGSATALGEVAQLLDNAGRIDEAAAFYCRAARAGHASALMGAAWMMKRAGRIDESAAFDRRAVQAGNLSAMWPGAELLLEAGRAEEAIRWLQGLAEAGHTEAVRAAAWVLGQTGRTREAMPWLRARAAAGDTSSLRSAARSADEAGHVEDAIVLYQCLAETGDSDALSRAAGLLRKAGRTREAVTWLRARTEADENQQALAQLATTLHQAGRIEEAVAAYERAAKAGDTHALSNAGTMMEHAGRMDEAVRFYQRAAEAGDSSVVYRVVWLLARTGSIGDAVTWLRTRHQAGDSIATLHLARLLSESGRAEEEAGHIDQALALYERAAEASDCTSLHAAAKMLEKADRVDEAVAFYQRAAELSDSREDSAFLQEAATMLESRGRGEEAARLRRYGFEPGKAIAQPWSVQ